MQERYLGDIHDFYKFNFLKFLSKKINQKIGLNWYLINPKNLGDNELKKNDGEKRDYLTKSSSYISDETLKKEMYYLKLSKNRKLEKFTKNSHLRFFLDFYNSELTKSNREKWFKQSIDFFKKNSLIFLDPDNGLLKKKNNNKTSIKYIFLDDIKEYNKVGKTVIYNQFQPFNKKHRIFLSEIIKLLKTKNLNVNLPVIRNRTSPNTFFLTIGKDIKLNIRLKKIYQQYKDEGCDDIELITI